MKNKKKIIDRLLPVAALILAVSVLLSSCSLSSAVGALGGKDSGTGKTPTGDTVVNNNQITDVTPLSGKPQLEELRMENNRITQLSGITGLTGLKYLLMYGNPVTVIEAVRDMPALEDLRVDDAQITDWSPADHVRFINTNNDYWGGSPWR